MNVRLIKKISSTGMQDKKKSCECQARYFLLLLLLKELLHKLILDIKLFLFMKVSFFLFFPPTFQGKHLFPMPGIPEQDNKEAEKLWKEASNSLKDPLIFTIQMASVVPFSKSAFLSLFT